MRIFCFCRCAVVLSTVFSLFLRIQYVYRRGEQAYEMLIVIEGRLTLVDEAGDEETAKVGTVIDEEVMLLPPEAVITRQTDAYAPVECSLSVLSAEDLIRLRQHRIEIDRHVRPHTDRARHEDTSRQIGAVFEQVDDDGNGTLDLDEFGEVLRLLHSKLNDKEIAKDFEEISASKNTDGSITREQFEAWWRKREDDSDGGKVAVLDQMQNRVNELDQLSVETEQQIQRISKLLIEAGVG
eukprot:SAG31_NODE_1366_length_8621_cov_4.579911_10_plen_239_part_00